MEKAFAPKQDKKKTVETHGGDLHQVQEPLPHGTRVSVGLPLFLQGGGFSSTAQGVIQRKSRNEDGVRFENEDQALIQPKLTMGQPGDAFEQEADRVAEDVMKMPAPNSGSLRRCACGGMVGPEGECAACRQRRLAAEKGAPHPGAPSPLVSGMHGVLSSPGHALDPADRALMESRFGRDFSRVRVHTDGRANRSAQAISALAYTSGQDIVFGAGHYRPGTTPGNQLLAHELAHTVQQSGRGAPILQRVVNFDIRQTNITPQIAGGLTDAELLQQLSTVRAYMAGLDQNSTDYQGARENLRILEQVQASRTLSTLIGAGSTQLGSQVARPPGLPLPGGYMLRPLQGLPSSLVDSLPDGALTTITPAMLQGLATGESTPNATEITPGAPVVPQRDSVPSPLVNASAGAYTGLETNLLTYGLNPAGESAIGIVAFPRYSFPRAFTGMSSFIPEHPVLWGHTAVIVRLNGRIVRVVSYAPSNLIKAGLDLDVAPAPNLVGEGSVRLGTASTPAAVYNDRLILLNSKLRSLEVGMPEAQVRAFLDGLPEGQVYGLASPAGNSAYTAIPSQFYSQGGAPGSCPNCIDWAVPQVEGELGSRITTASGVPITDIAAQTGALPVPHEANQGQLMRVLANAERDPAAIAPILGPDGVPLPMTTGGLSTGMQVLKWGGRVMLVVGAALTIHEIATAPEGEGGRTAAGALSGFAGSFALGAMAGLVCGPGALVCSVVLGLGFGFVGGVLGRDLGESVYDAATGQHKPLYSDRLFPSVATVDDADIPRVVCSGQGNCHVPARYLSPNWRDREGQRLFGGFPPRERELTQDDIQRLLQFIQPAGGTGQQQSVQ